MLSRTERFSRSELHTGPLLTLHGVSVFFNKYLAIDDVSVDIRRGEILAVVGEHRAGKSTLVNVIAGIVKPQRGRVLINGHDRIAATPVIEMVHQGMQTIPTLSVLDSIFINSPVPFRRAALRKMVETAKAVLSELGVVVPLDSKLRDLTPDQQIFVDIARAVCRKPDVLIFDELDKKLSPEKLEQVYKVLFRLRHQGVAIVYVSNNFDELFSFSDRICVLRNGRVAGIEESQELDKITLINLTYSFMLTRGELTQENKALHFQKKYNETIIENLSDGVAIVTESGELYRMNPQALRWVRGDGSELIGLPLTKWFQAFEFTEIDDIIETIANRQYGTWKAVERDDETFQIETIPFTDELHQHLGTIVTLENVTEQRNFEDYLIRTEKIASISELAAGIAHEVNNPLSIIANYLELMREDPHNVRVHGEVLKIERQLKRITDVMSNMLSFSKVNTGTNEAIDAPGLVREVIHLLDQKLSLPSLNVTVELPEAGKGVLISGNRTLLSQVIVNLIDNAIEAIHQRGDIRVQVKHSGEGDVVDIIVSDSGEGMSDETKDRLFTPFFSTKATKKNAGLGLAICQHIIDAHHGLIFVNRDHMTHFHVRLPALEVMGDLGREWES
jgi:two-component system sensor histidine kinase AtoS